MAVSPVRALLAAHLQASWNHSRIDLGKTGRAVYWIIASVLALVIVVPVLALIAGAGLYVGQELPNPVLVRVVGGVLAYLVLVGGSVGRGRVLDWDGVRIFPVRLRSLFLAELIAGLGDLLPMIFALLSGALLLGIGIARPVLLPLLPIPWIGTIGGLLCFRHIIGSLASHLVRRFRVALALVAVLAIAGVFVIKTVGRPTPAMLLLVLDALPATQSVRGLSDSLGGHWGLALLRQVYPIVMLVGLFLVSAFTLKRESEPRDAAMPTGGGDTLWTFSSPAQGVAKLHFTSVLHSSLGMLGIVAPLISLAVLKNLLPAAAFRSVWSVPALLSWLVLINTGMHLNQFGLDGSGIKALLVLPIRPADLLYGKALSLGLFQGMQALLLMTLMVIFGALGPMAALAAMFLSGSQFLLHVGVGHWSSARIPRPLARNIFKSTEKTSPAPMLMLLSIGLTAASTVLFGGAYVLAARLSSTILLSAMMLLFAFMALLYWRLIVPGAARYFHQSRERLVQFLA